MKITRFIILFLFIHTLADAQSIEVLTDSEVVGVIGSKISTNIKLRNNSKKTIHVRVKRVERQLSTGQSNYFCWGDDCYTVGTTLLPKIITLKPGQTTTHFKSVLKAGISESESAVKYIFYNNDNPTDETEFEVLYNIIDNKPKSLLLRNHSISMTNVYPNPVNTFAIIDYNIIKNGISAKIIVYNVLGGNVGEYQLQRHDTNLKIHTADFKPGVYFYSVYVDNENIATRKFIVKR